MKRPAMWLAVGVVGLLAGCKMNEFGVVPESELQAQIAEREKTVTETHQEPIFYMQGEGKRLGKEKTWSGPLVTEKDSGSLSPSLIVIITMLSS